MDQELATATRGRVLLVNSKIKSVLSSDLTFSFEGYQADIPL
jgi:hypothetical protein